jgi:NADH-quinone oxidoreductase subunit M
MVELKLLGIGILTWMIFLPVVGMIVLMLIPKSSEKYAKYISVAFTSVLLILSVLMLMKYDPSKAGVNSIDGFQFVEKTTWIDVPAFLWEGSIHVDYFLGVDGISFPMVLLTALISLIGAIASFSVKKNERGSFSLFSGR